MIRRRLWEGDGYLVEPCIRCVELNCARFLDAESFIKYVCDIPPIPHSCGLGAK